MSLSMWVRAARPKTLTASWIPVLVGTVLAFKETGLFNYFIFSCCLLSSLFIQIATNYINDALDFKKGADTVDRVGPKRMTLEGFVDYKGMLRAGFLCLLIAVLFGFPLVIQGGWPVILLGLVAVSLAYGYTGGPWPLAYVGLGDIFVYLFFGLAAVCGSFYLQTQTVTASSVVVGSQIGLLAVVLIAINNFRDMKQDSNSGKKTVAVRFGSKFVRTEIFICSMLPFFIGLIWFLCGTNFKWAAFLPLVAFPLALYIALKITKMEPSAEFNRYLGLAGGLHMVFGTLLCIGIFFS